LRLRREDAEALVALADVLGTLPRETAKPERRDPFRTCSLVALDLRQCREELEIFQEDRSIPYRDGVLPVWHDLHRILQELNLLVESPEASDPWNPWREVARLWLPEAIYDPLHRLGATAGEYSAEVPPVGYSYNDGAWTSATGVACDLGFLSRVLEGAVSSCEGSLGQHLRAWAAGLRRQSETLAMSLPAEPAEQEITRTEIPVAAGSNNAGGEVAGETP